MASSSSAPLRIGILGTARIARLFAAGVKSSSKVVITAVASRDEGKAQAFAREIGTQHAHSSYEAMLADPAIDAVYIPLPTGLRGEWVLRAAAAGKHVVCEKPCARSVAELQKMLEACWRKGVQFMDGVMFTHSRRFQRLREVLDDGQSIGQLRRITSAFSFYGAKEFFASNIRAQSELEPLGCLGDLGWYCIRLALWVMNWQMPVQVTGRLLSEGRGANSPSAVPTEFSGELLFEGGVSAGFYCSFVTTLEQWAIISGTHGYAQIPDFVLPFTGKELAFEIRKSDYQIRGCDFQMQTDHQEVALPEWSHGHTTAQETNCYRAFADQARSGRLTETWPEAALKTQKVTCACLDSARADGRAILLG